MAHDVFISYSSKDKTVADAICASIENKKIRCWIAPRDISPGADWGKSIIDAINSSSLMVLIFSEDSNESPQVLREVERAVSKGIPIVPFRIDDIMPNNSMEYFISTTHWLDALTPPMENHVENLVRIVDNILNPSSYGKKENLKDNYLAEKSKKSTLKKVLNYSAMALTGFFVFMSAFMIVGANTDSFYKILLGIMIISYIFLIDIIFFKSYLNLFKREKIKYFIYRRESIFKLALFLLIWMIVFSSFGAQNHYSENGISFAYSGIWTINENQGTSLVSLSIGEPPVFINIYKKNGSLDKVFADAYLSYSNDSDIKGLERFNDSYIIKYRKSTMGNDTIVEESWIEKNNGLYVIRYQAPTMEDFDYYYSDFAKVISSFSVS